MKNRSRGDITEAANINCNVDPLLCLFLSCKNVMQFESSEFSEAN